MTPRQLGTGVHAKERYKGESKKEGLREATEEAHGRGATTYKGSG